MAKRSIIRIIIGVFVLALLILITVSRTNKYDNKYKAFIDEYYNIYFDYAEAIDIKDTAGTLDILHNDINREKITKIKELLGTIENEVPEEKKANYRKLYEWYEELEYINNVKGDWSSLSISEKRKTSMILLKIDRRRINWNDPNSNIVWE